jgi:hypothetical protein
VFSSSVGIIVLSGGGGVAGSVVFVRGAVFSPRLWRLYEVCVGSGVGG